MAAVVNKVLHAWLKVCLKNYHGKQMSTNLFKGEVVLKDLGMSLSFFSIWFAFILC